mgnify:CR=1 FL=1
MQFRRSFFILAGTPDILETIADFKFLPEWDKSVLRVGTDLEAFRIGKQYAVTLLFEGKNFDMTYSISEYKPNTYVELIGLNDYVKAVDKIQVHARDNGCVVTYDVNIMFKFPFWLLDPILKYRFKPVVDEAVEGLKSFSENIVNGNDYRFNQK